MIAALVEGNSIRSVERMKGVHRDTIRGCWLESLMDATADGRNDARFYLSASPARRDLGLCRHEAKDGAPAGIEPTSLATCTRS